MNVYGLIKKRYLNGEMSESDVRRCAKEGILSTAEAELILSLKPEEDEKEKE